MPVVHADPPDHVNRLTTARRRARTRASRCAGCWPLVAIVALVSALVYRHGVAPRSSRSRRWSGIAPSSTTSSPSNAAAAVAAFVALYVAVVALSLPGGAVLTITGGFLFGVAHRRRRRLGGRDGRRHLIFLIAKSAVGEHLARRAGPLAAQLAEGFRADAFSYLLFLRLVPLFPFWLVNLAPALFGVRPATFVAATAIGIIPATFAFAFVGAGLDSVDRRAGGRLPGLRGGGASGLPARCCDPAIAR